MSAVEPSADRLGAELLRAWSPQGAFGIGGARMVAAGFRAVAPPHAAMGLGELWRHLSHIRANAASLRAAFDDKPDLFLAIDAPDFHLPLAREARRRGIRTVGWVSPQLWAWRRGRAARVAQAYDQLLCLFSFEPPLYLGTGLDARWLGHPAVDQARPSAREPGLVALFPGSRPAEVARHLPVFLEATRGLGRVVVARAPGITLPPGVEAVDGDEAIARADRALTKSGTVTLELALAGVPTVVAHRVHPLTYAVGRRLVRGVRFLALPNLLLGRRALPELVQEFDAPTLRRALDAARVPPAEELRGLLGPGDVARRVAELLGA
jgi:lipid-A-disaccharide synthase